MEKVPNTIIIKTPDGDINASGTIFPTGIYDRDDPVERKPPEEPLEEQPTPEN